MCDAGAFTSVDEAVFGLLGDTPWVRKWWSDLSSGKIRDTSLIKMSGLNRKQWERRKKRIRETG